MARDGHVDEAGSGGAPGGLTRHRTPLRDNLEWIAFIVLVVLVVRQMVVEAFRIQHGSMAPTLLGIHKEIRCPNCDRVFDVGEARIGPGGQVQCSNCDYHWEGAGTYGEDGEPLRFRRPSSLGWLWNSATTDNGTPLRPADAANRIRRDACRIFVNKFIYQLRKPRRWEVVVFQYPVFSLRCRLCGWQGETESLEDVVCPDCGSQEFAVTTKDFIKRVAGLAQEWRRVRGRPDRPKAQGHPEGALVPRVRFQLYASAGGCAHVGLLCSTRAMAVFAAGRHAARRRPQRAQSRYGILRAAHSRLLSLRRITL